MGRIKNYTNDGTVSDKDYLLGGDADNLDATKTYLLEDVRDYVLQDTEFGSGITGPQGVQGPAGPIGPVGPAGLTWRGAWVSGTSYVANDAVGYNGASWFCILATSGTTTPNLATTNWALLASQGAQGIQGVQGPTGPSGPVGPIGSGGIVNKGDWVSNTSYFVGDVVEYWQNQSYYYCKNAHNNSFTPEQSSDWLRFGLNKVTTSSNFKGQGSYSDPLTMGFYKRSNTLYANGTGNPLRMQNYFIGMELPTGVTESFARVSTGTYELRYTGDISIPELDITNNAYYNEVVFSNNPDIRHTSTNNTISGSNRTLVFTFTNTIGGVLTDGFFRLLYSITFYKN